MTRTPLHLTPHDAEDAAAGLHHDDASLGAAIRAFVAQSDQLDALADRIVAAAIGGVGVFVVAVLAMGW